LVKRHYDLIKNQHKKPIVAIKTSSKKCNSIFVRMNFLHERWEKRIKIVLIIYFQGKVEKYFGRCDYTYILQKLCPDDWDTIDQLKDQQFLRSTIPLICDEIIENFDIIPLSKGYQAWF
jgi:hypothetical protein